MKKALGILLILLSCSGNASQTTHLSRVDVDVFDFESVRRGAGLYANYCMGCHSLRQMRYSRIAKDLDLSEETMRREFMFGDAKVHDYIRSSMTPQDGEAAFGVAPPDLSLMARARGPDWIFSYLKGFYLDPSRPFGVNNLVAENVAMPNVLWELQGTQEPVLKREKGANVVAGVKLVKEGSMSRKAFDRALTDLVNFLAYVAEPARLERLPLGKYVIVFLIVLTFFLYKLKKEYWKKIA
jgi:ubiquinol-cytochrome c reductase cytochrome c1 subunit